MPIADVNGCPIHYEIAGSGPPLIFVHGGFGGAGTGVGGSVPAWRDEFARHLQVITYDRRSSGRSGYPESPHTMADLAGDAYGVLQHLGIERAAVMGTSAGGPIVLEFALRHPEALTCLVVTESAPMFFPSEEDRRRLRDRIALMVNEGPEAAYEARRTAGTVGLQLFATSRPSASAEDEEQRKARQAAIQQQLGALTREDRVRMYAGELRNYNAYVDYDVSDRLTRISAPTLVINATGDSIFPPAMVDWAALTARMPDARYVALPGGEHGSVSADAGSMATILAFVRAHSGDGSGMSMQTTAGATT